MEFHKFGPSTTLFTCVHGVSYPDICGECEDVWNKETKSQSSRDQVTERQDESQSR
jgi:hypothetical protein